MSTPEPIRWASHPSDTPMPKVHRRQLVAERMMVNRLRLEAGLEVPTHAHDNEQIVLVLRGRLRLHVGTDEREVILSDDEAYVLPANVPHRAEALEDCEVFDLFSPPTESTGIDA